jgi:beta-lactamase superfamily II metal-dependent hydrolase
MSTASYQAACYFLDVGQGTSQLILLGNGEAIVIDGGPSAETILRVLDRYVDTIVALIVSHNDADHHRGAYEILERYPGTLETVYFLEDRPTDRLGLYALAEQRFRAGSIREVIRLERSDRFHVLYENSDKGLSLELVYPTFLDNLAARRKNDANVTSAVLSLDCGKKRIVFTGDSKIESWQWIRQRLGAAIRCDVLTVPHHGGVIWDAPRDANDQTVGRSQEVTEQLNWFFRSAVNCDYAIVSTGTNNRYGHPRPEVLKAIRESADEPPAILCTELTHNCCERSLLRSLRPGILATSPSSVTYLHDQPPRHDASSVACAGTVIVKLGRENLVVEPARDHRLRIEALRQHSGWHPCCLR